MKKIKLKFEVDKSGYFINRKAWLRKIVGGELINPLYGIEICEIEELGPKLTLLLLLAAPDYFTILLMKWQNTKNKSK